MRTWLFDVDGVLTSPTEKQINEPGILVELISRLEKGEPVGFNTGRSIDFVIEKVLVLLENKIQDKKLLDHVFAIGEKGGVWITYKDGQRSEFVDESIKVPLELANKIKELIQQNYSETMYFDETKKTMISTELKKGENLEEYHKVQPQLVNEMNKLLSDSKIQGLKIDPTTIAVDIENSHVGKALGAKRFLSLLDERSITPDNFTAFGDSNSDFEMFDELIRQGKDVKFVYVGKPVKRIDFEKPNEMYDKGTLEYLKAN